MSAVPVQTMHIVGEPHRVPDRLLGTDGPKFGGLLADGQYAWLASGVNFVLYSIRLRSAVCTKSFDDSTGHENAEITFVKELNNHKETCNLLLVGCSFKTSGILFICQFPTLTTYRCIEIPNPISYIGTIINELPIKDQLCDEFKIMSTVLLVGLASGAVYAIDLRQDYIEKKWKRYEVFVHESKPSKLCIIRKNEDCQEVKKMSDDSDCHLGMFLNKNFYTYCIKQYSGKLNFSVSSLLYIEELNTIAIGYSTGHFQLWDCKIMCTIFLLEEPKCVMPITHIIFLEPSDDPNNLCYIWIIQSDNTSLPTATMIALTYEKRIVMPNGCVSYRDHKESSIKFEMSFKRETGIGRCISALSLCNMKIARNETDTDEDCKITICAIFIEIQQNVDNDPESYIFLFDINQWYKAQMPSTINHLASNSYASFVKLPHIGGRYLDFNISQRTLRPFINYNFRHNIKELYFPSSIYFECDCLVGSEVIKLKHTGIQQEILDQLLSKSWKLLVNPTLVFSQCLQTNLRPFFWNKPNDYVNYSLPDKRSFVISILVEYKMTTVLRACAEKWKNGDYISSGATILHLVQCVWEHVMIVQQFADELCISLFDYSSTQMIKRNKRLLNYYLSQMFCVKYFLEDLQENYGHNINVDLSIRVNTLNLLTKYFKAVECFLNYGLLPETLEVKDLTHCHIKCNFSSLSQYANKRRIEFGDSKLYLIDAIISNELKGNKLIEYEKHNNGNIATKCIYPPTNIQCLLEIYLNATYSDQMKTFVTNYFLIDVCFTQKLNMSIVNHICNFAVQLDVENEGLNKLCHASWLFDHDEFEKAMDILFTNKKWMEVNSESLNWFHWTVIKLLMVKSEYYWARLYFKLVDINIVGIDNHKFYINIQFMNNLYVDALSYISARPLEEKQILFEYFFDRCRETNNLNILLENLWEKDEENLFYSYLDKFKDTQAIKFQLLFLLQRGRYLEAAELNKSLGNIHQSKFDDSLIITSLIVSKFEQSIPETMKKSYIYPPHKHLYKKTDIPIITKNSESKIFIDGSNRKTTILNNWNSSIKSSDSINLILPANKKFKRTNVNEMMRPTRENGLEILNNKVVKKNYTSPTCAHISSVLKIGSPEKHSKVLSIKHKKASVSGTELNLSLPRNDTTNTEEFGSEEYRDFPMDVNHEIKPVCTNKESNFDDAVSTSVSKPTEISVVESLDEYSNCTSHSVLIINDGYYENLNSFEELSDSKTKQCNINEPVVKEEQFNSNKLLISNDELVETKQLVSVDPKDIFIQLSPLKSPRVIDNDIFLNHTQNKLCSNHETRSNDVRSCNMDQINEHQSIDVNNVVLKSSTPEVKYEEENDSTSSVSSSDYKIEWNDDSDLEVTRYGRFKCQTKEMIENSNEEYNEVRSDDKGVYLELSNIVTTAEHEKICVDFSENKSDEEMEGNTFEYKFIQSNNVNLCEQIINFTKNTNSISEHHDVKCVDYSIGTKLNDLELNKKKSTTSIDNLNTINLIKYKSQKRKNTDYSDKKTLENNEKTKIEDKMYNLEQSDFSYEINETTISDDDLFSNKKSYEDEKLIDLETVNAIFTNNDEEKYSELQNKNLVVLDSEILDLSCTKSLESDILDLSCTKSSVNSKIKITNCTEQKYQKKHIFKCTGEDKEDEIDDCKYRLEKTDSSNNQNNIEQNNVNDKTYFIDSMSSDKNKEKYSKRPNSDLAVFDTEIEDLSISDDWCSTNKGGHQKKLEPENKNPSFLYSKLEELSSINTSVDSKLSTSSEMEKTDDVNISTIPDDLSYINKDEDKNNSKLQNEGSSHLYSEIEELPSMNTSVDSKLSTSSEMEKTGDVNMPTIPDDLCSIKKGEDKKKTELLNENVTCLYSEIEELTSMNTLVDSKLNTPSEMEKTDNVNLTTNSNNLSSIINGEDKKKSELLNENVSCLYSEIEELTSMNTLVDSKLNTPSEMEKTDNVNLATISNHLSSIINGEDKKNYSELQCDEDLACLFPEIEELSSTKTSIDRKLSTTICMKNENPKSTHIVCTDKKNPGADDCEIFEDEENNIEQSNSFHQRNNIEQDGVSLNKNENNFDKETSEFRRLNDLQELRFSSGENIQKVDTSKKIKKVDDDNKITDFGDIFGTEGSDNKDKMKNFKSSNLMSSNEEKKEYIERPNECLVVLNSENEGLFCKNLENNNKESDSYEKRKDEEQNTLKPYDTFLGEIEESNIKQEHDKFNDGDHDISLKQFIENFSDFDCVGLEQNDDVKFEDSIDNNFKNPNKSFQKCSDNLNHILEKELKGDIEYEMMKSNKSVNIIPCTFGLKENISLNNNDYNVGHIKREDKNVETCIVKDEDIVQNDSIINKNDNSLNISDIYSVPILDFKHIAMIETESSKPETSEVDQSTSLLLNESFLSQQEIEDKNFIDQMYISLTKCKTVEYKQSLDTPSIELETKFIFPDNNKQIVDNRKSEKAKLINVVHNISEQESTTESILTSNLNIHLNSKPNSLQPKSNLRNTTLYENELVRSNSHHLLNNDDFGTNGINYSKSLNELPPNIIKNREAPKNVIVEKPSKNIPNEDIQPQKEENAQPTMLSASNVTRSLCGQHTENQNLDITLCTNTIYKDDLLQLNFITHDQSSVLLNRDCLPQSNQSLKSSEVQQKQLMVVLNPLSDTVLNKYYKIKENTIHQNIVIQKPDNLKNNIKNIRTDIPLVENSNLRASSRKRKIIKPKCELSCCVNAPLKLKRPMKKSSNIIDEVKPSTSDTCTNKHMIQNSSYQAKRRPKGKSVPLSDGHIKSLKSSSKSKTNLVQLGIKSSNLLESPEIVEDNNGKADFPFLEKRSKSQKNTGSKKFKSDPLKSLSPLVKSNISAKNIDSLELISEKEKDVKMEHNHPSTYLQQNTEVNTPKRANPVQTNPLVTFSVVKKKQKKNKSHKLSPLIIRRHLTSQFSSIEDQIEKYDSEPLTSEIQPSITSIQSASKKCVAHSQKSHIIDGSPKPVIR